LISITCKLPPKPYDCTLKQAEYKTQYHSFKLKDSTFNINGNIKYLNFC
jgi:hypothetical protein